MDGEAEEIRELEVVSAQNPGAYRRVEVGAAQVCQVRDNVAAGVADGVEPGQGSRRARGQVREAAGRVAGVDDYGPAARQGEDERVL